MTSRSREIASRLGHRIRKQIPFRDILEDTWEQIKKSQLLMVASSLAYTTILSIIPLLAMSFAIFKAFGGMEKMFETIQPFILSNLAEGASDEVLGHIENFIAKAHASVVGVGGFLGLVFTSISMLSSVEKSINSVWGAKITRSWFQRLSSYWLFITLGPVAFSFVLGLATSSETPLLRYLPGGAAIFLVTIAIFYALYKYVPNTAVSWRSAIISASVTAVFWNLASAAYTLYTRRAVSYSKIYGSLSAVPLLLLWIYIVWVIVLSGAALTAVLQRKLHFKPEQAKS